MPAFFAFSASRRYKRSRVSRKLKRRAKLTHRMQQLDGNVDVDRVALNRDQTLMHVDRSARHGRRPGIRHTNNALRLCSDLVDLDSAFAND
jgi:hypothetical protein